MDWTCNFFTREVSPTFHYHQSFVTISHTFPRVQREEEVGTLHLFIGSEHEGETTFFITFFGGGREISPNFPGNFGEISSSHDLLAQ